MNRIFILFSLLIVCSSLCEAQLMKKLKTKASKGILKEIGLEEEEEKAEDVDIDVNSGNSNNRSSQNTRGGGLKITPPDVQSNIADARSALESKSYSQTRFSIQEAMRGVELEIGEQILESFPTSVKGLDYLKDQDQIVTSGVGFVGLNIGRNYQSNDQTAEVLINNNSMMMSSVNAYLTSSAYSQTGQSDGTQYKRTTVQGNKALIQYSDQSGYSLSVPLGQSSLFILKCVNFESEDDVMSASNEFDLAEIKSLLGEN